MLTLELDSIGTVAVLVTLSAGASYGMTQVVKSLWTGWLTHRKAIEPWFYNATLRSVACLSGAAMGYFSLEDVVGAGIGFASGAINTFVVHTVKRFIAAKVRS